jgi:chemotaxis protein methyltransferase CheR
MIAISRLEIDRFVSEIAGRLGLALDVEHGAAAVSAVLRDRLRETASESVAEYFARITRAEVSVLAERLTVGETYFFRYREQFDALAAALPALVARRKGRPLRILSAACSSGEEAGTIAIVLRMSLPDEIATMSKVLAVDVNPAAIRKAKRGRYSEWSLRDIPDPIRTRWFRARHPEHELDAGVRAILSFAEKNLGDPDDQLWGAEAYDVVFCRNALMYFAEDAAAAVIARIVRSLAPHGLLFLGPTETHLGRARGLSVRSSHGAFYYERVDEPSSSALGPFDLRASGDVHETWNLARLDLGDRWAEDILDATQRIAALMPQLQASIVPEAAKDLHSERDVTSPAVDLAPAMGHFRADRLREAPRAQPDADDQDPEAQMVRCLSLANSGNLRDAERACEAVIALDATHAGARYILALCREHVGDFAAAIENDHAAVYLDPRFAMPHLHLGLLARQRGKQDEAARELRQAAALLAEADGTDVLLFGGGLRRDVLIELCRAELRACEILP